MSTDTVEADSSQGCLGILMLDTRFPRIPGDVGNSATWPFPVCYEIVAGASAERVVRGRGDGLLEPFLLAADRLVARGAVGIATSCGFLSLFQADIANHVAVPVATSTLMQIPLIQRMLPKEKRVGVITVSAESLSVQHLASVGADADTPVAGIDPSASFARSVLGDAADLDADAAERDILDAGDRLLRSHPNIGAIVLECTNMAPYSQALAAQTGLPIHDIVSFLSWFQQGLNPRRFPRPR